MEPQSEMCSYGCGTSLVWPCSNDEEFNKCPRKATAERNQKIAQMFFDRQNKIRELASLLSDEELDKTLKKYKKKAKVSNVIRF